MAKKKPISPIRMNAGVSSYQLGKNAEVVVENHLREQGYQVMTAKGQDLLVSVNGGYDTLRLEVKAAFRNSRGVFEACLWKYTTRKSDGAKVKSQDHTGADRVIMLCVEDDGFTHVYAIPTVVISELSNLHISDSPNSKGRYEEYRCPHGIITL